MGMPKSAFDLSQTYGIPIAACYRKIRLLESAGMLICVERKLTRAGKRMGYYRSAVLQAHIIIERNRIRAVISFVDGRSIENDYTKEMATIVGMNERSNLNAVC
jgi:predicted transcriptional regulator